MVMYTIKGLLKKGVNILRETNIDNPMLDGEVLLMHVLDIDRVGLIRDRDRILEMDFINLYLRLIEERKQGKPVQYITGHQEFMGLDFDVGEGVLIPRPDTEILVERVLELLKGIEKPKIADLCTGSGAIGVSLAYYIKDAYVYATDLSKDALKYCRVNALKNSVMDRLKIFEGNLAEPLFLEGLEGELNALVSNPPYISSGEMESLPTSVRCYEPHLALYGGEEGLDFYEKILKVAPRLLKKGGILAFEIGYNQGEALKKMIKNTGKFADINIEKDLAGFDRCVYCYFEGVDGYVR